MGNRHVIASGALRVEVASLGAELQRIQDADGREYLWDGDPAWWTGRSPLLFPIVGALRDDRYRLAGETYTLPKHGFARRSTFELIEATAAAATLRLRHDDATRAVYPFAFELDVTYAVEGSALRMAATLRNPGSAPLPASFGFHPALRWPLPGAERGRHRIRFDQPEPGPIRRVDAAGLLRPRPEPSPVEGALLLPTDAMFEDDALILDAPASRGLRFEAPGAAHAIRVDFPDMPMLGIWTKPGAPFLCIEPWAGIADPQSFAGDFTDKPGIESVAPGAERLFAMRIALEAAPTS